MSRAIEQEKKDRALLKHLVDACREYIEALDAGYDVLASAATDKIRELVKQEPNKQI